MTPMLYSYMVVNFTSSIPLPPSQHRVSLYFMSDVNATLARVPWSSCSKLGNQMLDPCSPTNLSRG